MKLLKVYRTEQDLVIETSKGNRYCRLFAGRWVDIDSLENKCIDLIGSKVVTSAKWGYSDDYYFGDIEFDSDSTDLSNSNNITTKNSEKTKFPKFSKDERSVRRIFGPPGTGKTTTLMKIIEKRLSEGLLPKEIAFVSFSNEAANVGKRRIIEHLPQYHQKDFINFRTLHSLSVSLGCSGGKKFMDGDHMRKFDKTIGKKTVWREMGSAETAVVRDEHF
jgi:hypothetical protein